MADLTERQVAQALFALDAMADEWAESTNLYAMVRANVLTDESASKLVTLMKQAWVEGAYAGRISQFTDAPQRPAQETSDVHVYLCGWCGRGFRDDVDARNGHQEKCTMRRRQEKAKDG